MTKPNVMVQGHEYELTVLLGNNLKIADDIGVLTYIDHDGCMVRDDLIFKSSDVKTLLATWTCKLEPSGNGKRTFMELQLDIVNFGLCILAFTVKVYKSKVQRHAHSGTALRNVLAGYTKVEDEISLRTQHWVHVHR